MAQNVEELKVLFDTFQAALNPKVFNGTIKPLNPWDFSGEYDQIAMKDTIIQTILG